MEELFDIVEIFSSNGVDALLDAFSNNSKNLLSLSLDLMLRFVKELQFAHALPACLAAQLGPHHSLFVISESTMG